jgi:PAS domain S-box-containing protein
VKKDSFKQRSLRANATSGYTVRGKMMRLVLVITAISVCVAGIAMLTHDLQVYRESWASDLSNEAQILALSTVPALEFDDHQIAQRNLAALRDRPRVLVGALYSADGRLYASYARAAGASPPAIPPALGLRISGERVEISSPMMRGEERVGTLYLLARYDVIGRIEAYASIFVAVMALSLVVAFLLSRQLQRAITEPLDAMTHVAREIVERRDYSVRAPNTTDNEIGIVVGAFNGMLDEVENRARASAQANEALQREVEVRQAAEAALSVATARLESTLAAAEIGSWAWDVRANQFTADRNLAALYGLADEELLNGDPKQHHRFIHPDDLGAVRAADMEAMSSAVLPATEFRVRLPNGSERWMARRGKVQLGADGTPSLISGVLIDISAQKLAEAALLEADRRKDEFLATLAHELRNPLAPIRHAVKLLEAKAADEQQQQWGRAVIGRQVQRMALLLDDLLDVSRITRGRLDLRIDVVELRSVVDAALEVARPLIDAKGQQLTIKLPDQWLTLSCDPLRLSQSLSNLLTNAAKYTDEGGRINLTVELSPSELMFSVKDTGIGLEPQAIPTLFEMFSQLDPAIDRAEGGLGIGLALVKGLIALHGGQVEVRSAGVGLGSEFIIHLPRSIVKVENDIPAPPVAKPRGVGSTRCKVLIADDNHDAADSMGLVLQFGGYEVCVAHTGKEALEMAKQQRPEVILLDIGLPDMTGYEVARDIRRQEWGRKVYLMAITGWGQNEDKERALAAGFDQHLTKPVDVDQVEQLLHGFLDSREVV